MNCVVGSFQLPNTLKKWSLSIFFILILIILTTVNVYFIDKREKRNRNSYLGLTFEALLKIMRTLKHITLVGKEDEYIC